MKNNSLELVRLIENNPTLPVVPVVDSEVVADDWHSWWKGKLGKCSIEEIIEGSERFFIKSIDDWEDVAADLDKELYLYGTDEDLEKFVNNLQWERVILIWIEA